jgi:hypothetical protein
MIFVSPLMKVNKPFSEYAYLGFRKKAFSKYSMNETFRYFVACYW